MTEWKKVKLGDVVTKLGDGIHGTPKYTQNGEYAFINGNNLYNNRIVIKSDTKRVNGHEFLKYKKELTERTLFVSINGTIGNVAKYNNEKIILGKSACYLNVDKNYNKEFVFYILKSPMFQQYIETYATGTTIKNVSLKLMRDYEFLLPPLPTQKKIAEVLSCLDAKIELNRRINENLEQQAQAIFKEWFVDFKPFQNKEFIESEYGKIPKDWSYYKLEDLCEVITKGTTPTTLGKKFTEAGINFIKGESILEDHSIDWSKVSHIDDETHNLLARSKIATDDIVFTIAGTLGRFMIIDDTMIPANTNQAVAIIRPQKKIHPLVLYSYFIADWHNTFYTKNIQQSVQANLSLTTIKSLPILLPKNDILKKYEKLIIPIFSTIKQNQLENIKLATIRDTLLPKLMSGEIEI